MRRLLVGIIVCLAIPLALLAATAHSSTRSSSRIACGTERWTVKTLQDQPVLRPAKFTTIHFLVTRPAPAHLADTRLPFEHNVYTLEAAVTLVRSEDDGDFHLVLRSGSDQMIAE